MKDYLYKKRVSIDIYNAYLHIIISNSHEKVRRVIPTYEDDYVFASAYYCEIDNLEAFAVIINPDFKPSVLTHGFIAHEAVHIANYIALSRGIEADPSNDEPMAYLIGWITDEIHKFVSAKGKKIKLKR